MKNLEKEREKFLKKIKKENIDFDTAKFRLIHYDWLSKTFGNCNEINNVGFIWNDYLKTYNIMKEKSNKI